MLSSCSPASSESIPPVVQAVSVLGSASNIYEFALLVAVESESPVISVVPDFVNTLIEPRAVALIFTTLTDFIVPEIPLLLVLSKFTVCLSPITLVD